MDISARIKELRTMYNLKSGEFAGQLGITPVYLSYLEGGSKKPSLETLEKICSALGITLSEFFAENITLTPEATQLMNIVKKLDSPKVKLLLSMAENLYKPIVPIECPACHNISNEPLDMVQMKQGMICLKCGVQFFPDGTLI